MTQETLNKLFSLSDGLTLPTTFADPDLPDCPLIYCNAAFEDLTGFDRTAVIGRNCRFLQGDDVSPDAKAALREATTKLLSCTVVLSNIRANGHPFNNFLLVEPITLPTGKKILMGCQSEFRTFDTAQQIELGADALIARYADMRRHFSDLQTLFQDALQMRSETAVLMVKNYLLRQSALARGR